MNDLISQMDRMLDRMANETLQGVVYFADAETMWNIDVAIGLDGHSNHGQILKHWYRHDRPIPFVAFTPHPEGIGLLPPTFTAKGA